MDPYLAELDRMGMCLIVWMNGEVIFTSSSKGIRPHLEALEVLGSQSLRGSVMADKIVGRAAALLMLYSIPQEIHAGVITSRAKELLENGGVSVFPGNVVSAIKERDGKIYCPFEAMVQGIMDPGVAYPAIVAKMRDLK